MDKLNVFNLPLSVIVNAENLGFAVACNQGTRGSEADYLLFLNPDTRLFEDFLIKPLTFMEQPDNQNIGIAGIQLVPAPAHAFQCLVCSFLRCWGLTASFLNISQVTL